MADILVIEDDLTFSLMLTAWLRKKGLQVEAAASLKAAREKLCEGVRLILSDLYLPDGDGIAFLRALRAEGGGQPFIIMTSYAQIQTAVQAIKQGAVDYIPKPFNQDELWTKIQALLQASSTESKEEEEGDVEGCSPLMRQLYEHIALVAPTEMSVLITGSSGTGKEYVARRIHRLSERKGAPFVAVDCGAIPRELAASEFFGHLKGSFTGAIDNKTGAFEAAKGGTLFLDEIGNLNYDIQAQLLRALQERSIKPVGGNQLLKTDVRLLAATNEDLVAAIQAGRFRQDLYHRINEFTIHLPDLCQRGDDLLLFAEHFLRQANRELKKQVQGFEEDVLDLFRSYAWPGNLRQMKNAVRYAVLLAKGERIGLGELPEEIRRKEKPEVSDRSNLRLHDEDQERGQIEEAMRKAGGNKTRAAQLLGVDRKTLYNKLKTYGQ
ncbi:MAG: sigma-54 dependent transcriptional regulator [Tannerella sp.]|jgi:two-component system response regulator HydG|nr:sigma-54 dependent transcriptional regulator [Tannerella sp.]